MNIIPNPRLDLGYASRNRIGVSGPESSVGYPGMELDPSVGYLGLGSDSAVRYLEMEHGSGPRMNSQETETSKVNPELYAELPRRNINPKPKKNKPRSKSGVSTVRTEISSFVPMMQGSELSPTASVQSRVSEQSSSRPSINSATYTRHRPIQPSQVHKYNILILLKLQIIY